MNLSEIKCSPIIFPEEIYYDGETYFQFGDCYDFINLKEISRSKFNELESIEYYKSFEDNFYSRSKDNFYSRSNGHFSTIGGQSPIDGEIGFFGCYSEEKIIFFATFSSSNPFFKSCSIGDYLYFFSSAGICIRVDKERRISSATHLEIFNNI